MNPYDPRLPPPRPSHSGLSIASVVLGVIAFLAGILPFVGFLGLLAIFLGLADTTAADPSHRQKRHDLSKVGIILGGLATLGAVVWTVFFVWLSTAAPHGSCPHLYAFDGTEFQLDADLASGALYKGAERDDTDRLESLRAVDGRYLVRLQNDLEEVDNVDSLSLLVVDAPEDLEVLPTQSGALVAVTGAKPPLRSSLQTVATREVRTLEFPRPASARGALVIRARNTAFAEDAFVRYLAKMGQGVRPMMEMFTSTEEGCACYKGYLDEEIVRLGLPLSIAAGNTTASLKLVGPATLRTQVVPIDLPAGEGPVVVTLESTTRFWEIESVSLAAFDPTALSVQVLTPKSALAQNGQDLVGLLLANDHQRVSLDRGQHVDVRFDVPKLEEGKKRTVVAKLRGYYDLDIGGPKGVNLAQILAHRWGFVSLPEFARSL